VAPYRGRFGGFGRLFSKTREKAKEKVRKRIEERRAEITLRKAIREEEQAKEMARQKAQRLKRIQEEERIRATQGGFLTRSFKAALKQAREEVKKSI